MVLGTAHWPLTAPTTELNMPTEFIKTFERFNLYYNNKHSVPFSPDSLTRLR
jgi:cullin 1